jgi:PHD/YefM family antitoxin component YafN of YafNO toxin-antitoxin module
VLARLAPPSAAWLELKRKSRRQVCTPTCTHRCTLADMVVPQILSYRELRDGLAAVLDRLRRSPGTVVFVGAHRRPEAVIVSVERYEDLQEASERQHAVAAALASVRADGLEPSEQDLDLFVAVAAGEMSTDELRNRILDRYRR